MSKLVTLVDISPVNKGLLVRTTLASEPIDKVIVTCKGTEPKQFFPQSRCEIYGYSLEELKITALLLRQHNIDELDLKNLAEIFRLGYNKAIRDTNKSIEQAVTKFFKDLGRR